MKPVTTEDILELLEGGIVSAALGAALELGLFWLLAERPFPAAELARTLDIPPNRCRFWLQILARLGLLEDGPAGYAPTALARTAILGTLSRDAWAFQAQEYRESAWFGRDLAANIARPLADWQTRDRPPPDYFERLQADPGFAARFTRKLSEIHAALAGQVAGLLDLRGVRSLLDLGGGSGVVSFALLRRQPGLAAVVVDVENVCRAGRELAAEHHLAGRVTYLAADFLHDDLPSGFDLVLLCDVGESGEPLFRRVHALLNPGGRLVVVDKFAPGRTAPPPSRITAAFLQALQHPAASVDFTTAADVRARLQHAGFRAVSARPVPPADGLPWNVDWVMLEARKAKNAG